MSKGNWPITDPTWKNSIRTWSLGHPVNRAIPPVVRRVPATN